MLLPGTLIGNRYEIVTPVGRGGMAVVYRARDTRLLREVALKVLNVEEEDDTFYFHREARAAAALRHHNIIQIYDYSGMHETPVFLVMELINGCNLDELVDQYHPIPSWLLAAIGCSVASALAHAHAHDVIHRDVKPENVMLEDVGRVLLTDFGIAKAFRHAAKLGNTVVAQHTRLSGTPEFMAPEQLLEEPVGPPTDVFALGSLLYFMATGMSPFAESNPLDVLKRIVAVDYLDIESQCPDLPKPLATLIGACLQKRSDDRPSSEKVRKTCERFLHSQAMLQYEEHIRRLFTGEAPVDTATGYPIQARQESAASSAVTEIASTNAALAQTEIHRSEQTEIVSSNSAPARRRRRLLWPSVALTLGLSLAAVAVLSSLPEDVAPDIEDITEQVVHTDEKIAEPVADASPAEFHQRDLTPPTTPASPPSKPVGEPEQSAPAARESPSVPSADRPQRAPTRPKTKPAKGVGKPQVAKTASAEIAAPAMLEIIVKPWGLVLLDGTSRGYTPAVRLLTVPAGQHNVEVQHPTLGNRRKVVHLKGGEKTTLTFDLRK